MRTNNFTQLLVLGIFKNRHTGEIVSHAGTFLRQIENNHVVVRYYDPNRSELLGKGGKTIDYEELFKHFEIISVYALEGRPVTEDEEEQIKHKMTEIMTGERTAERQAYIKKRKVQGAKNSQKKGVRKNKGYRQGKKAKNAMKQAKKRLEDT